MKAWFMKYALYVKLALVACAIGGVAYGAWHVRGLGVEKEKQIAVDDATKDLTQKFENEQRQRKHYQELADTKLEQLLKAVGNIKSTHTTVTNNITKEVQANPEFYNQQLPQTGYEQWITSRNLVNAAAAASAGQAASAPVSSSQPQ